jgi:hypothetical protein
MNNDGARIFESCLIPKGEGPMPVYYKCKICGNEHPSPIVFPDEMSFNNSAFENTVFKCSIRFQKATYHKEDIFWQDKVTPFD